MVGLFMGFINVFSRRATGFHRRAKLFELNFFIRKTFLIDGQTRWAKSSSQPVNLPGACPLMKRLLLGCKLLVHGSLNLG